MREVIKEGRDVNEAIDLACAQLGVDRGQVGFEIIELPKTAFFGLRKKPAKVRVYVDEPEQPKKKPAPKKPAKPEREQKQDIKAEPKKEQKKEPEPRKEERAEKPAKIAEAPRPERAEKPEKPEKQEKPERAEKPEQMMGETLKEGAEPAAERETARFVPMEETEGKARAACEYVRSVLLEMGVDARITVNQNENAIIIRLAGDGLGVVIGRRGETLDALQYLTGLVANRCEGDYLRVTIDTGNYREKRERTLQQLARKLSASALRSGRSSMLEPMNPYERRIIHSTVSQIEGVTSSSIGEEPNRRVVISPVNAKPRLPRKPGRPGAPGGPRRRFDDRREVRTDNRVENRGENRDRVENKDRGEFRERGEFRDRGPRRDRPRTEAHPTSTAVDREYAKELEREPALAKPEQPAQTEARITREKPKDEAGGLPLYGKIEL